MTISLRWCILQMSEHALYFSALIWRVGHAVWTKQQNVTMLTISPLNTSCCFYSCGMLNYVYRPFIQTSCHLHHPYPTLVCDGFLTKLSHRTLTATQWSRLVVRCTVLYVCLLMRYIQSQGLCRAITGSKLPIHFSDTFFMYISASVALIVFLRQASPLLVVSS